MEFFSLLIGTIVLRPYVFVFLAFYLWIGMTCMGGKRTALFTVIAYTIAFLSEYSSTRNGFPYGLYSYIETTRNRELWVSNVPFMDSLSYCFLSFISYRVSLLLWSPIRKNGWDIRLATSADIQKSWRVIFTGALFFMLMDVIIDPVAFLGDRWFLGQIYTYEHEGQYFNIPLTNFGGWFLVGSTILFAYTRISSFMKDPSPMELKPGAPALALWGPALYFGVLVFNLVVTFYIGEVKLGLCGIALFSALLAVVVLRCKRG